MHNPNSISSITGKLILLISLTLGVIGLLWLTTWFLPLRAAGTPATAASAAPRTFPATVVTGVSPSIWNGAENVVAGGDDGPTAAQRQLVQERLAAFRTAGLLPATPTAAVTHAWPMRQAAGLNDFGFYAVTQLTDNDLNYGSILDYACGQRTYDLTTPAYNHGGTDIVPWPFPWNQMAANAVEVIVSAPGVIVDKFADDSDDARCALVPPVTYGNYIGVAHNDGSVSWYGHLKFGTLTSKNIGDTVAAGEYLGIVGSSGYSSAPHLHFEINTADLVPGEQKDPFAGACNLLNPDTRSLWQSQPPYYNSGVNKLTVGEHAPIFNQCPDADVPNDAAEINAGQTIYFSAYQREMPEDLVTTYAVYRPDHSLFASWIWPSPEVTRTIPENPYLVARTFPWYAPVNVPLGQWTYEVAIDGQNQTYVKPFSIVAPAGDNILYVSPDSSGSIGPLSYGPEDILAYDLGAQTWSMYFDGSDVGITTDLTSVAFKKSLIVLGFANTVQIPRRFQPPLTVEPQDLVAFKPTSLGQNTSGRFTLAFDGSDVGLTTSDEAIDATAVQGADLLISTVGNFTVPADPGGGTSLSGTGQQVIRFKASVYGGTTQGYFEMALNSPVLQSPGENIDAVWANPNDPEIYLSTTGSYNVKGVKGGDDDIFMCFENQEDCSFMFFWESGSFGVDAFEYKPAPTNQ